MKPEPGENPDVVVIGGGVIGLSIARELAGCGLSIVLIDRGPIGRAASWAGAGILPPSDPAHARHAVEKMSAESFRLHPVLAGELQMETGIDNGFRRCGAVFVARTAGEVAALAGQCSEWEQSGIRVQQLTLDELQRQMPALRHAAPGIRMAALVPDEVQIRNPDHLQALQASCGRRGVAMFANAGSVQLLPRDGQVNQVRTDNGKRWSPGKVCVAAGAWSAELLEPLECHISTLPVRGQMLLYKLPRRTFHQVLYEGTRYVVPRDDGHVLVGSTLEQAGFDATTTPDVIEDLKSFAASLFSDLTVDRLVDAWAGLRPATWDGFPYLGPVPGFGNVWAACGHFRSGLLLSTATSIVMRQLILDQPPLFDLAPFRLDRG